MQKSFLSLSIIPIALSLLISLIIIPHIVNSLIDSGYQVKLVYNKNPSFIFFQNNNNHTNWITNNSDVIWPTPSYKKITSDFGTRISPTTGAATMHGGIDIGAAQGSNILSIANGKVTHASWYGANGYTVIIDHGGGYKSIYGHVDPDFLVKVGDEVLQGDVIAKVGPKYVKSTSYTTYKDSNGNTTNGATTGPHLHFAISKNGKKINPKSLYN